MTCVDDPSKDHGSVMKRFDMDESQHCTEEVQSRFRTCTVLQAANGDLEAMCYTGYSEQVRRGSSVQRQCCWNLVVLFTAYGVLSFVSWVRQGDLDMKKSE